MDLFNTGVLYDFAFKYADNHRNELSKYKDWKNFQQYLKTSNYWTDFVIYVDSKKVIYTKDDLSKSKESIENMLQAYICRNILGDKGFYPIINQKDKTLEKAIQVVETEIE
jgi:carboxyl-terminal processing protease